ncbi:hypothetical protein CFOL_v3_22540 [Cephalotus follicularis]|uniref:Uncharacterized protein n=1 Tax=Cephalotus follicularis TaxID=3775 RepID=A0A1Q3CFT8_CEPFO|nr:hypothetical protein CFOL_v3_22540 [Cephalotus follicularis]
MNSLSTITPTFYYNPISVIHHKLPTGTFALNFPISSKSIHHLTQQPSSSSLTILNSHYPSNPQSNQDEEEEEEETLVQDLRVPDHWMLPSKALEESEWLKVTLHKWLDDEYCPEETNVEISKVAARCFYRSLLEKQTDLGEILLKMAQDLESVSYKESFHGAFSSANAAVDLILQRIEQA